MTHISNFIANFYGGVNCKRFRFCCFRTNYIFSLLAKLFYHGFCRGNSFIFTRLKKFFHQLIELKYDFNFLAPFRRVFIVSCASFRKYLNYTGLISLYFRTETILTTTSNGIFFGFELLLGRFCVGGENVMRFNFI